MEPPTSPAVRLASPRRDPAARPERPITGADCHSTSIGLRPAPETQKQHPADAKMRFGNAPLAHHLQPNRLLICQARQSSTFFKVRSVGSALQLHSSLQASSRQPSISVSVDLVANSSRPRPTPPSTPPGGILGGTAAAHQHHPSWHRHLSRRIAQQRFAAINPSLVAAQSHWASLHTFCGLHSSHDCRRGPAALIRSLHIASFASPRDFFHLALQFLPPFQARAPRAAGACRIHTGSSETAALFPHLLVLNGHSRPFSRLVSLSPYRHALNRL
ncbi:hypothetical protein FALBO_13482 [Fusarium albosuccineum]|uniref:Uncharacterized protein n=1 Tax=Fusarium albosuccineum TaxID=1237068 RepID=A0A8H4KYQ9_9HYPO|nr:hypothetical protein FALBO_13482 [Fusarium albosuccineum]